MKIGVMGALSLLGCLGSPFFNSHAQSTGALIKGKVTDAATRAPLENVNVFIDNTMLGSSTNVGGYYSIPGVPPGTYQLVVSMMGYEAQKATIHLTQAGVKQIDFRLRSVVLQAPEIEVVEIVSPEWQKHFARFKDLFIGTSGNAEECKIANPKVLDFTFEKGTQTLQAKADQILEIENRALGYRIFYLLDNFRASETEFQYLGTARFETLIPENDQELANWQENRRKSYMGSLRHFLRSLISNQLKEEGFLVFASPVAEAMIDQPGLEKVDPEALFSQGDYPFEKSIHFAQFLQVHYVREMEEKAYIYWRINHDPNLLNIPKRSYTELLRPREQISWIVMKRAYARVDTAGYLYDPHALKTYGYWSWKNVADMLPLEYVPK